jgi:hypothetical protein
MTVPGPGARSTRAAPGFPLLAVWFHQIVASPTFLQARLSRLPARFGSSRAMSITGTSATVFMTGSMWSRAASALCAGSHNGWPLVGIGVAVVVNALWIGILTYNLFLLCCSKALTLMTALSSPFSGRTIARYPAGVGTAECGAGAEDGGHAPHSRCRPGLGGGCGKAFHTCEGS